MNPLWGPLNISPFEKIMATMDANQYIQIDTIGLTILTISDANHMISLQTSEGPIKIKHAASTSIFANDELPIILDVESEKARIDIWDSSRRLVYSKRPLNVTSISFSTSKPLQEPQSPTVPKNDPGCQNPRPTRKEPQDNRKTQ